MSILKRVQSHVPMPENCCVGFFPGPTYVNKLKNSPHNHIQQTSHEAKPIFS